MKKDLRWRIIYGYSPADYISIPEEYLEKAKYSFITGKIFSYKDKIISGKEIKRIEKDYRYYTGWFDNYSPQEPEDFVQIERDVPIRDIEARSALADERVRLIIQNNNPALLQNPEQLDKLLLE